MRFWQCFPFIRSNNGNIVCRYWLSFMFVLCTFEKYIGEYIEKYLILLIVWNFTYYKVNTCFRQVTVLHSSAVGVRRPQLWQLPGPRARCWECPQLVQESESGGGSGDRVQACSRHSSGTFLLLHMVGSIGVNVRHSLKSLLWNTL